MQEVRALVRGATGDMVLVNGKGSVVPLRYYLFQESARRLKAAADHGAVQPLGVQKGAAKVVPMYPCGA